MSDKRSVSTDALETLGTIIGDGAGRDAIHIAVEPVVAAEMLRPGQDIGFLGDNTVSASAKKLLGIVDPFLKAPLREGEHFWMLIYPRQITSLRHVWSHPDFGDPCGAQTIAGYDERWIRDFAAKVGLRYDILIDGARDYVASKKAGGWGEFLCFGGLLEGENVPDEFWQHYEAVTGEIVAEDHRGSFFTCSC